MRYSFAKRIYNAEDGTRILAFHQVGDTKQEYVKFNLNVLEDQRLQMSDLDFAVMLVRALEAATGFRLTPDEIEYAVEDI